MPDDTESPSQIPPPKVSVLREFCNRGWQTLASFYGFELLAEDMRDHVMSQGTAIKVGRVLWSLFFFGMICVAAGFSISSCRRNDAAEIWQQTSQAKENLANSHKDQKDKVEFENIKLRQERDRFEAKLTTAESRANIPTQTNSTPDQRIELLLQKFESLSAQVTRAIPKKRELSPDATAAIVSLLKLSNPLTVSVTHETSANAEIKDFAEQLRAVFSAGGFQAGGVDQVMLSGRGYRGLVIAVPGRSGGGGQVAVPKNLGLALERIFSEIKQEVRVSLSADAAVHIALGEAE